MFKSAVLLFVAAGASFGATWDLAGNFNSTNNGSASGVFSYGWGSTPEAFAAMSVVNLDCFVGSPTACLTNGGSFPNVSGILWTGTGSTLVSGTVNLVPGFVNMDPQLTGGAILRFTAPWADVFGIAGNFRGDDSGQHATSGTVYANGSSLGSTSVTAFNALYSFSYTSISLNAGETIDILVSSASDCCYLSTGVGGTITSLTDGPSGIPEPATVMLIAGALPLLIWRSRRA